MVILNVIHVYFTLTGLKTTWIEDYLPATLQLWILCKDVFFKEDKDCFFVLDTAMRLSRKRNYRVPFEQRGLRGKEE